VFGKLARLGSGKKKTSSSSSKSKKKTDKKAAAAHQHHPHGPDDVDADSESESDDHSEAEEKQKTTAAAATGSAVVAASSQTSTPRDKPKNESDGVASGNEEEEEEDDGGYFIFDLRSKVRCTLAGPRNLCAWEEFNHLSSTLRYCTSRASSSLAIVVDTQSNSLRTRTTAHAHARHAVRNFKAHEVAELFVLVPATPSPAGSSVQEGPQPSGLAGLMASIQQRTRAPLALIQKIFARVEKTVGQPKTCTCIFIGTLVFVLRSLFFVLRSSSSLIAHVRRPRFGRASRHQRGKGSAYVCGTCLSLIFRVLIAIVSCASCAQCCTTRSRARAVRAG
jgi:hypothetical protein